MRTLAEGSQGTITLNFFDLDEGAVIPDASSITYEISCETNGTDIRSGTLASAAAVDLPLQAADVAIINDENPYEYRLLSVHCTIGGAVLNQEYRYRVKNISVVGA